MVDPQLAVTASGLLDLSTGLSHTALLKDAERREGVARGLNVWITIFLLKIKTTYEIILKIIICNFFSSSRVLLLAASRLVCEKKVNDHLQRFPYLFYER